MIRKTLFLFVFGIANVCYAQKKAQSNLVIAISVDKNLMNQDKLEANINKLNSLEFQIAKLHFKNKKKLQSLRQLIRSLEVVRDMMDCYPKENQPISFEVLGSQEPNILKDMSLSTTVASAELPSLNSKHAQFIRAIVARNEELQNTQMNLLKDITNVNIKTRENLEILMQRFVENQNKMFESEREQQYEQRVQEYSEKLYQSQHQVKKAVDNIKQYYSKAYRRALK